MSFFWVNIGSSFNEVKEQNFLWAPQYGVNKNGKMFNPTSWETVKDVKAGDIKLKSRQDGPKKREFKLVSVTDHSDINY